MKALLNYFDFILFTKLKMATCTHEDGSLSKERFKAGALSKFEYFQWIILCSVNIHLLDTYQQ